MNTTDEIKFKPATEDCLKTKTKDSKIVDKSTSCPPDAYYLVYIVLLIHGVGILLPWDMFINAEDYFRSYKLNSTLASPDTDKVALDKYRGDFLSYLSVISMLPNTIFTGLNLLVNVSSENFRFRINLSLVSQLIIFGVTVLLAFLDSSSWPIAFLHITLLSVCILQIFSGIYSNSLFGVTANLPGSYMNAVLIGNNTCGIFTSLMNILCIAISPSAKLAAIYYFFTAFAVLAICLISYNLLPLLNFYKFHHVREVSQVKRLDLESIAKLKEDSSVGETSFSKLLKVRWGVLKECWVQCLNLFLVFLVTLALFPTVLANTEPTSNIISRQYYIPLTVFFLFNLFAVLGNVASNYTTWPGKERVWIPIVLRFLFVPFFLYCNFKPTAVDRKWPVLIENDAIFILGNVLFALTSGYFSSLGMIFVSEDMKGERGSIASMWGSFFFTLGLLVGGYLSFLMSWVVS